MQAQTHKDTTSDVKHARTGQYETFVNCRKTVVTCLYVTDVTRAITAGNKTRQRRNRTQAKSLNVSSTQTM